MMKNQNSGKILLLCVLACAYLHACVLAQGDVSMSAHEVTASEYCKFLNQNSVADPNHLYDEKMETDPEVACVVRLGTPGKYFYQVIAERENFPVTYLSSCNEEKYCAMTDDVIFGDDNICDSSLKCNLSNFAVDSTSSPTLMLATDSPKSQSSSE